jgi:hypothetical protein
MGLLTADERKRLIESLLKIPLASDENWRQGLLAGLPDPLRTGIAGSSVPRIHLTIIVDTVDNAVWACLPDGTWSVIMVIENALPYVDGSTLGDVLKTLLTGLQTRSAQQAPPAPSAPVSPAIQPAPAGELLPGGDPGVAEPVAMALNPFELRSKTLVGRDQEIRRVFDKLIAKNDCCIVGPPGTGKSLLLDVVLDRLPDKLNCQAQEYLRINFGTIENRRDLQMALVTALGGKRPTEWRSLLRTKPLRVLALDDLQVMPTNLRGYDMRIWLRGLNQDFGIQLLGTSNVRLDVLFRNDPAESSPFANIFGPPVELGPLPPSACRQLVADRLKGTPFRVDQFEDIITLPHPPQELLNLCADRYEELRRSA